MINLTWRASLKFILIAISEKLINVITQNIYLGQLLMSITEGAPRITLRVVSYLQSERILPFFTAVITLVQTTLQTLFILNASRRCCYTYDQLNRKPGREMVSYLSTTLTSVLLVKLYGLWSSRFTTSSLYANSEVSLCNTD